MPTRMPLTYEQECQLHDGARSDEKFYVQVEQPTYNGWGVDWLFRRVKWDIQFASYILLWVFRWYSGEEKADGSRTYWWNEGLHYPGYVICTTPKEKFSFRLSLKTPDRERWDNMGGI